MSTLAPRVVVVWRRSEYDELIARHATRGQAEFFLRTRGQTLDTLDGRHQALRSARHAVASAIPADWRRADVERGDLARFAFAGDDVVVIVGQDGLVANVARYLDGHPVIGIDPEPGRNAGVLVRHRPGDCRRLLEATSDRSRVELRTLVEARLDDGQSLLALNEIYIGHPSHQSARYLVTAPEGRQSRQSSSGLLAGTGTGASGWGRSLAAERGSTMPLPSPVEDSLWWFTREAWPGPAFDIACTQGRVDRDQVLRLRSETDALVVFGDGIEHDRLTVSWGQEVTLRTATRRLALVG